MSKVKIPLEVEPKLTFEEAHAKAVAEVLEKYPEEKLEYRKPRTPSFREKVMHEDTDLEAYITKNIKMSELSKGVMTKVMTEKDFFSDLGDEHVIGVAGLLMLNEILQSEEIEVFVVNWLISRKSRKGGRSRKDIVEMFKSLNEEISGLKSKFMDRFGGMFQ